MKLSFYPYKERPKWTPYATWASFLVRAAPGLRDRLKLELLWASTSGTQTELALGVLLDLDTVAGLLPLHTMRQTWSYAWVSCPHHLGSWWTVSTLLPQLMVPQAHRCLHAGRMDYVAHRRQGYRAALRGYSAIFYGTPRVLLGLGEHEEALKAASWLMARPATLLGDATAPVALC